MTLIVVTCSSYKPCLRTKVQKIEELERQNAGLEQDLELLRSSEFLEQHTRKGGKKAGWIGQVAGQLLFLNI